MAHREASAKKNTSISSVSSSHAPSSAQQNIPPPEAHSAVSTKMITLPAVSIPSAASVWEKNACVRVTGRVCSSPTVRPFIRYDHTAIAMKQPNSRDMTTDAVMVSTTRLCCVTSSRVRLRFTVSRQSLVLRSICMGRITTHTAT